MRWAGVLALVVSAGCAAAQRAPSTTAAVSQNDALPQELDQRLREFTTRLSQSNVRPVGVLSQGVITRGTPVRTRVEVEAGRCAAIVAIATTGVRDIDARLFDPGGDVVTEDVEPDAHPTVQVCASERAPRRVWHVLEAYDGQGAFAIARYDVPQGQSDAVARVIGGRPGVAPGGSEGRSELERRVLEFRDGIVRRGFTLYGEGRRVAFAGQGASRLPVRVTPEQCYTAAAFAEGDVTDVDLRVFDPDGEEVVRDLGPERDAFAQFCPLASGTWSVEVSSRGGSGNAILQAFAADAASVGGANALWLGQGRPMDHGGASLDDRRRAHVDALRARGWAPMAAGPLAHTASQTLGAGEVKEWSFDVPANRCGAVFALAGSGLGRVSVDLYDAQGDLLGAGRAGAGTAMASRCTTRPERWTARVVARQGAGTVELAGFETATPAWASGVDPIAVGQALSMLGVADPAWRTVGDPERARVGAGAVRTHSVERAAGRCARVAAVTASSVPFVHVALRAQAGGEALNESVASGGASVARCGPAAERLRAELRSEPAGAAEGDALWLVWERGDASPSTGP
ncbi:MAG: hypothetical protein R3A52_20635 [Polyangiales bacterium]